MDEYEDDENKITKVYAITREEWREIEMGEKENEQI